MILVTRKKLFTTCQMRVFHFMSVVLSTALVSVLLFLFLLLLLRYLLKCKLMIAVFPARPGQQAPDQSVPALDRSGPLRTRKGSPGLMCRCRISTASAIDCSGPFLDRQASPGSGRSRTQAPDHSGPCRTSTASSGSKPRHTLTRKNFGRYSR